MAHLINIINCFIPLSATIMILVHVCCDRYQPIDLDETQDGDREDGVEVASPASVQRRQRQLTKNRQDVTNFTKYNK